MWILVNYVSHNCWVRLSTNSEWGLHEKLSACEWKPWIVVGHLHFLIIVRMFIFSQRELIIWTFRPKNSSYMYIYVLIIALSFREDTRMACYCLKGENNLDMPGKNMSWNSGCNIAYDAVIGIVVEFQIFSISNHWHWYFWGTMRETRLYIL